MTPLPAYIDREAFDEYLTMRKKDKKEMSPRSYRERLRELQAIKEGGYDVTYCIDAATNGHWLMFYPVERREIQSTRAAQVAKERAEFEAQMAVSNPADRSRVAEQVAQVKRNLTRVA